VRVLWLVTGLAVAVVPVAGAPPSQKEVLRRASAFVTRSASELPRLVATETMVQELTTPKTAAGQSVSKFLTRRSIPITRHSVAEFAWVAISAEIDPIGFRDVVEVDGQPVGVRTRLVDLLHGSGQASWSQARAILQEGARHNLSPGARNFNLPTVVLFFLLPERVPRFSWKRRSEPNAPTWELEFRERERPSLIRQGDGENAFSRGRVWIDVATGAILRTELVLKFDPIVYTLTTTFERVAAMDLILPVALDERYTSPEETVTGRATYSDYRRFQTGARLIQ
jgi:hypothetical protein